MRTSNRRNRGLIGLLIYRIPPRRTSGTLSRHLQAMLAMDNPVDKTGGTPELVATITVPHADPGHRVRANDGYDFRTVRYLSVNSVRHDPTYDHGAQSAGRARNAALLHISSDHPVIPQASGPLSRIVPAGAAM